ncbi:hypothetical protein GCM10020367_53050 [Streptomyces sannanensis]|uniref:Peptidoglycan bridge formation glycyltransferase FemA/FemB family protein n=1 Tax=Streptomyces sannanensis TaxID=285536 RepID=A0ABP6SIP3_9ACTN
MSALLVTAGEGQDVEIRGLDADEHRAFLDMHPGASFLQCPAWAGVKDQWRSEILGWAGESGELSGAALVLLRQFPGTRKYFAYLPEGPVADWADPDIDRWLSPLLRHLRRLGAFAVRIGPSSAYRRWDAHRIKSLTGRGRRISDVLACEVDPLGTAVAERLMPGSPRYIQTMRGFGYRFGPL